MTTYTEEWKTAITTSRRIIEVSDQGMMRIRDKETGELIRDRFPGYYNKYTGYFGSYAGNQVHRLVALMFVPNPEGFEQVGHKNDDRTDNRADNLIWITRRMNNNTRRANRLRREGLLAAPKHTGMRVRGVKDGQTKEWDNARQCSDDLGCSRVLVLNALNHKLSAKRAKGWTLEWIDA